MRSLILGVCAALFVILPPAAAQAQVAFFYKELPAIALDHEKVDIRISLEYDAESAKKQYFMNPMMCVRISNGSDKTLYLDLGNSFLTVNGESRCYYIPSSTSTTEGQSRGVGVNLGIISGALAGVNVGTTTSSSQTTTTFSQRVIAIPPMSAKRMEAQQLIIAPIPEIGLYCHPRLNNLPLCRPNAGKYPRVPVGQTQTFDPFDTHIQFSVMVTGSFDEGLTDTFTLRRGYYVDRAACYKNGGMMDVYEGKKSQEKLLDVFPEWNTWGDFFLIEVM